MVTITHDFEDEVIDRLARIETKIEKMDRLEQRVMALEASNNQRKGALALISALCGLAGSLLGIIGGRLF